MAGISVWWVEVGLLNNETGHMVIHLEGQRLTAHAKRTLVRKGPKRTEETSNNLQ